MVGQIVTEQENVSALEDNKCGPVEESTNLDDLLFPWEFYSKPERVSGPSGTGKELKLICH